MMRSVGDGQQALDHGDIDVLVITRSVNKIVNYLNYEIIS